MIEGDKKKIAKMNIDFRIPPEVLIKVITEPEKVPELLKEYKISKEVLAKEMERLSKLISVRGDDMIMV